jgi:two-component system sensor histidine kinase/response regulator
VVLYPGSEQDRNLWSDRQHDKHNGAYLAIFAMTAFDSRKPCLRAGMDGYITKPIRCSGIEKMRSGLPGSPSAPVGAASEKILWSKADALDRVGGDEDLLREVCQIFLEESPKLLEKLRQAIVDVNADAVMRAAHCLRGELGYLGAAGALQAAQELEDMGQQKNLFRAAEWLVVLEREMASLSLVLKDPAGAIQ